MTNQKSINPNESADSSQPAEKPPQPPPKPSSSLPNLPNGTRIPVHPTSMIKNMLQDSIEEIELIRLIKKTTIADASSKEQAAFPLPPNFGDRVNEIGKFMREYYATEPTAAAAKENYRRALFESCVLLEYTFEPERLEVFKVTTENIFAKAGKWPQQIISDKELFRQFLRIEMRILEASGVNDETRERIEKALANAGAQLKNEQTSPEVVVEAFTTLQMEVCQMEMEVRQMEMEEVQRMAGEETVKAAFAKTTNVLAACAGVLNVALSIAASPFALTVAAVSLAVSAKAAKLYFLEK